MKNIKLKISVSLIIIITFLIIPAYAIDNHKPVFCDDCHSSRFSIGAEVDDDWCNCHKYVDVNNKLNLTLFQDSHNANTCKACHGVRDAKVFHTLHENVSGSCARCHGEDGNAIPDKTLNECGGCHGKKVHVIHQDNLTRICSKCHGTRPESNPASQSSISTNKFTSGLYAKAVNYQQYTLLELIKRLVGRA